MLILIKVIRNYSLKSISKLFTIFLILFIMR